MFQPFLFLKWSFSPRPMPVLLIHGIRQLCWSSSFATPTYFHWRFRLRWWVVQGVHGLAINPITQILALALEFFTSEKNRLCWLSHITLRLVPLRFTPDWTCVDAGQKIKSSVRHWTKRARPAKSNGAIFEIVLPVAQRWMIVARCPMLRSALGQKQTFRATRASSKPPILDAEARSPLNCVETCS